MSKVISTKLKSNYFRTDILKEMDKSAARDYLKNDMKFYLKSLLLYFDEEDQLKKSTFRQVTLISEDDKITPYPALINILLANKKINVQTYTYQKFNRLNQFLIEDNLKNNS